MHGQWVRLKGPPSLSLAFCSMMLLISFQQSRAQLCPFSSVEVSGNCLCSEGHQPLRTNLTYNATFNNTLNQTTPTNLTETESIAGCTACPAGKFKSSISNTMCLACEEGTYQNRTGSTECLACPANSWSQSASRSCDCVAGYTGEWLLDNCSACLPGTYKDTPGSQACSNCSAGTYMPFLGSNSSMDCLACPQFSSTAYPGQDSLDDCQCFPGFTVPMSSCPVGNETCFIPTPIDGCVACDFNHYKEGWNNQACERCPDNSTSPNASSNEFHCRCNPGLLRVRDQCIACAEMESVCKGCEWIELRGSNLRDDLMGIYRRTGLSDTGRYMWRVLSDNKTIQWTGEEWTIAGDNEAMPAFSVRVPTLLPGLIDAFWYNPLLVDMPWNVTDPVGQTSSADNLMQVRCLATPEHFLPTFREREIFSFGYNFYGELGRPENVVSQRPVWRPQPVDWDLGIGTQSRVIQQAYAGCHHTLAITEDGKLFSWGSNAKGQLGREKELGQGTANWEPEMVSSTDSVVSASAGGTFSLFMIDGSGQLYSFGSNAHGQLGRPEGAGEEEQWDIMPGPVEGVNHVTAYAAGRHHALAVTSQGVWSWGANRYGQLGREENIDTDADNYSPQMIENQAFGGEVPVAVATGRLHSLVLTSQGSVFSFGSNLRGQCGPNSRGRSQVGSHEAGPVPVRIDSSYFGGENVTTISASQHSSLVMTTSAKVFGFGRNFFGQLTAAGGMRGIGVADPVAVPIELTSTVPGDLEVQYVSTGSDHTVLTVRNTTSQLFVLAVGSNQFGQIGAEQALGSYSVNPIMSAKEAFDCASMAVNLSGLPPCPAGALELIASSAQCDHSLLIVERPHCPPGSESRNLGLQPCAPCAEGFYQPLDSQTACISCPQGLYSYSGSTTCIACPVGKNTLSNSTPPHQCFEGCGQGTYGTQRIQMLGVAPCVPCPVNTYQPIAGKYGLESCLPCPPDTGSTDVGLTDQSQCRDYCAPGFFSPDGLQPCMACPAGKYQPFKYSTFCFGCSAGTFSTPAALNCTNCTPGQFSGSDNSSSCDLCDYGTYQPFAGQSSCFGCSAFKTTGSLASTDPDSCETAIFYLFAAGDNRWGQLATGLLLPSVSEVNPNPVEIANDLGNRAGRFGAEAIRMLFAGYSHTLFVTESQIWSAGQNIYGQLGRMPSERSSCEFPDAPDLVCTSEAIPNDLPLPVNTTLLYNKTIAKAAAGRHLSVILTAEGKVYTFGYNRYGQLGRNTAPKEWDWEPRTISWSRDVPTLGSEGPPVPRIQDIAVGNYHVLLLDSNGTLWAFGSNRYGQLGVNISQGTWMGVYEPKLVDLGMTDAYVRSFAAGGFHSVVLLSDNTLWSFGSNSKGQLGVSENFGVWGGATWILQSIDPWNVASTDNMQIVSIQAGGRHTIVQTGDGALWGFGSNYYGQLALYDAVGSGFYMPTRLGMDLSQNGVYPGPFDGVTTITRFEAGRDFTIVTTEDNRAWLFGSNRFGQLVREANAGTWFANIDPISVSACDLDRRTGCEGFSVYSDPRSKYAGGDFVLIEISTGRCSPGTRGPPPFGRPGYEGNCVVCEAGKFSVVPGSTVCTVCAAGTFSSNFSTTCTNCPPHTYSGSPGSSNCTSCPVNTLTDGPMKTSIQDCKEICAPGEFSTSIVNGTGVEPCQLCQPGSFSSFPGSTTCQQCLVGEFSPLAAESCSRCPDGTTTRIGPGTSEADCLSICLPGTFNNVSGLSPCSPCPEGTFAASNRTLECQACAPNQGNIGTNNTECLPQCEAGYVGFHGLAPCAPCEAGFSNNESRKDSCSACSPGTFSLPAAAVCSICQSGSFSISSASTCTLCPAGQFQEQQQQTSCLLCPSGFVAPTVGLSQCTQCGIRESTFGETGQSSCSTCPPGTIYNDTIADCQTCGPGTFADSTSIVCTLCPLSTFNPSFGASVCSTCTFGTTYFEGATSAEDCVQIFDTFIQFDTPRAAEVASATIGFTPEMDIVAGEKVIIGLPEFDLLAPSEISGTFAAAWILADESRPYNALELSVRGGQVVQRGSTVTVDIPLSAGLVLPELGSTANNSKLTIETNAAQGPTPPVPIAQSPQFGSFGRYTTIVWDTDQLKIGTSVFMNVESGEILGFKLPQFEHICVANASCSGDAMGSENLTITYQGISTGTFGPTAKWFGNSSDLILEVADGQSLSDPEGASVFIVIKDLSLRSKPCNDVNPDLITISSDAEHGPVLPTVIAKVCRKKSGANVCCNGDQPCCLYA